MIRISLTAALIALGAMAHAQQGSPGLHFIENWDLDGDGQVTLAEATERRGDIFVTFDADDNGVLSPEEHDFFDEARANDIKENGMGKGMGRGNPAIMDRFTGIRSGASVPDFQAGWPHRCRFLHDRPAFFRKQH